MRLRMNDRRERRFEYLQQATGENTKSGALDVAADYYLSMAAGLVRIQLERWRCSCSAGVSKEA